MMLSVRLWRVVCVSFFCLNLFFVFLSSRNEVLGGALFLLPWALVLMLSDARRCLIEVLCEFGGLVAVSALFSLFVFAGCGLHECLRREVEGVVIPLLWVPVAALVRWMRRCVGEAALISSLFFILSSVVLVSSGWLIWQGVYEGQDRPSGFSRNVLISPSMFAMVCLLGVLKDGARGDGGTQIWVRRLFPWVAVVAVLGAMATHAKVGLLVFLVGVIARLILLPHSRRMTLWVSGPVVAAWLWVLLPRLHVVTVDVGLYQDGGRRTSFGERLDAIRWAFEHIWDHPFFGRGSVQVARDFNNRWIEWGVEKADVTPMLHLHNDYLQMTLAYGFPAAIFFVAFWCGLVAWGKSLGGGSIRGAGLVRERAWLIVMFCIFMSSFMVDSFTYWSSTWGMTMAAVGVGLGLWEGGNT